MVRRPIARVEPDLEGYLQKLFFRRQIATAGDAGDQRLGDEAGNVRPARQERVELAGLLQHRHVGAKKIWLGAVVIGAGGQRGEGGNGENLNNKLLHAGPLPDFFPAVIYGGMAVYTEVTDEACEAFLRLYDIGQLVAFRGIAEGVENSNYALKTTQGDFILTLYEQRVDPAELPWFLGLMEHFSAHGISAPRPVRGRDGANLNPLAGRIAAITTFLPGVWPRRVQVAHCGPLGAALAKLHLAGAGFLPTRRNALGPSGWAPLLAKCLPRADEIQPGLGAELTEALKTILAAWPAQLPTGHIHADLFPDNVFFLDGKISGLIDFYFAATDLLAYDVAVCLNAWCFERDFSFNVTKSQALLRAYDSIRKLNQAERAALPILAQGAAIRFLLTRLYDWQNTREGALVTPKNPIDYIRRLRFHRAAVSAAAYGL